MSNPAPHKKGRGLEGATGRPLTAKWIGSTMGSLSTGRNADLIDRLDTVRGALRAYSAIAKRLDEIVPPPSGPRRELQRQVNAAFRAYAAAVDGGDTDRIEVARDHFIEAGKRLKLAANVEVLAAIHKEGRP